MADYVAHKKQYWDKEKREWIPESILQFRLARYQGVWERQWLTKWQDFEDPMDLSWEPAKDLCRFSCWQVYERQRREQCFAAYAVSGFCREAKQEFDLSALVPELMALTLNYFEQFNECGEKPREWSALEKANRPQHTLKRKQKRGDGRKAKKQKLAEELRVAKGLRVSIARGCKAKRVEHGDGEGNANSKVCSFFGSSKGCWRGAICLWEHRDKNDCAPCPKYANGVCRYPVYCKFRHVSD